MPSDGSLLPVMVYVHGGAYKSGSGIVYNGTELSQRGNLIVVTINYRLDALGKTSGFDYEESDIVWLMHTKHKFKLSRPYELLAIYLLHGKKSF